MKNNNNRNLSQILADIIDFQRKIKELNKLRSKRALRINVSPVKPTWQSEATSLI